MQTAIGRNMCLCECVSACCTLLHQRSLSYFMNFAFDTFRRTPPETMQCMQHYTILRFASQPLAVLFTIWYCRVHTTHNTHLKNVCAHSHALCAAVVTASAIPSSHPFLAILRGVCAFSISVEPNSNWSKLIVSVLDGLPFTGASYQWNNLQIIKMFTTLHTDQWPATAAAGKLLCYFFRSSRFAINLLF